METEEYGRSKRLLALRLPHILNECRLYLHERLLMPIRPTIRATIFMVAALASFCAAANQSPSASDSLYGQLATLNISLRTASGQEREAGVVERYETLMTAMPPCPHDADDVAFIDDLFKATAFAQLYSLSQGHTDTLGCLYQALLQSGNSSDWHTLTYAGALISVARFSQANLLLQQLGDRQVSPLPHIAADHAAVANTQWRMLALESPSQAAITRWAPAPEHLHVVAVVHPACGFSARAMADIASNNDLAWLRENLLLLVPPQEELPIKGILEWNRAHPQLPMQRMYTRADWAALASLDTPTFYLMQGTQVMERFEGWPNDAGLQRLQAALAH